LHSVDPADLRTDWSGQRRPREREKKNVEVGDHGGRKKRERAIKKGARLRGE